MRNASLGTAKHEASRSRTSANHQENIIAYETLLTDLQDGILTVTLNRPERLNAFTPRMMRELVSVFDDVDTNDEVRVVIVTGAGRGFSAGADLAAGGDTFDSGAARGRKKTDGTPRDGAGILTLRIFECMKPVIAAVNGPAVGVGVTHTLPMDIRIASEKAKFGFVFARRGIVTDGASGWFLPRVVGISKAVEWVATGRVFSAQEALEAGLVSEVVSPEALLPRARELAAEIAENSSPMSVTLSRQLMWKMLGASHPMEAHRIESKVLHFMGSGPDAREGVESFLEKRPPRFKLKVSSDLPAFFPWWDEPSYEE
jgi:enoyl-CoA hydratase/carnithine racemase